MNNLPIDFITFCLIFLLVLNTISLWFGKLKEVNKIIDDHSTWIAGDKMFEDYEVDGIKGSQLVCHHEMEESRIPLAFLSQGLPLNAKA